ncbi:hypothetical protein [Pseudomonas sp. BF-B-28]|uniref:hypothetical protein n=1 Tax=Pseudomonas sp. BF-B-28 TaxID=2832353 RepID=UPI001CC0ED35|nr:hypothetical protein [Pseudomonas sp. BF-B-28]
MRTALHNGYNTVKTMCAELEVPCYRDALDLLTEQSPLIRKICIAAPSVEQQLLHNSYTLTNNEAPRWIVDDVILFRSQFAQNFIYCPICLCSEIITVFQDLKGLTICPIHKCSLVTECPVCHLREHWTKVNLLFCRCGFDRRNTKPKTGKLYDTERLDSFGCRSYIKDFSRIANLAQICDDIWQLRAPCDDKETLNLIDAVKGHTSTMIGAQMAQHSRFTCAMHLSPWVSSHPQLAVHAYNTISENCFNNGTCPLECCAEIHLTLKKLMYSMNDKKKFWPGKRIATENPLTAAPKIILKPYNARACELPLLVQKRKVAETAKARCTLKKATELLKCDNKTVLLLEKLGYLQRDHHIEQTKTQSHFIITESLIKFCRTYYLAQKLSNILGTKTYQLVRQLNLLGIAPETEQPGLHLYKRYIISKIWHNLIESLKTPKPLSPIVLPPTRDIHNLLTITNTSAVTTETKKNLHQF